MKLSTRLILSMAALVLFTAAAISVFSYRNIESIVLPRALERIETHTKLRATELEAYIHGARGDILGFRSAVALDGIVRAHLNGGADPIDGTSEATWRARMASRYAAELASKPAYLQFRIIGVEDGGRELVRVDRSGRNGAVRIVPDQELQRKGDSEYFRAAITMPQRGIYMSAVDLNREEGEVESLRVPLLRIAASNSFIPIACRMTGQNWHPCSLPSPPPRGSLRSAAAACTELPSCRCGCWILRASLSSKPFHTTT